MLSKYGRRLSEVIPFNCPDEIRKQATTLAFFNLWVVACLGVLLRCYPLFPISFPAYQNLLHAHSHFAFGGWVMPILFVLILEYFPGLARRAGYRHIRNISLLVHASAYGMLFSFPFQGYAALSITFSTLSILAGYYMAIVLWRASRRKRPDRPVRFLQSGLFFLVLSSVGPFATGPLIALDQAGMPLYYNAIYFYLHFQYNGFFTFAILAILYKMLERKSATINGNRVYYLLSIGCIPAYFLSTLWSHPPALVYVIAMVAAMLQMVGVFFFIKDVRGLQLTRDESFVVRIFQTAIFFFVVKNVLQLLSAWPGIADIAYTHRNFIIAYLHMVLLGFISAFAIGAILKEKGLYIYSASRRGVVLFFISFLLTEVLLVLNGMGIRIQVSKLSYLHLLLLFSSLFPIGIFIIWKNMRKMLHQPGSK